nr:beta-1,3-galactosyltransferase 7-like [Tanacetum cinerariifolium]
MRGYEAYEQFIAMSNQEAGGSGSGIKRTRAYIPREREEAKQRLPDDYFGGDETPFKYPEENFIRSFSEDLKFMLRFGFCRWKMVAADLGFLVKINLVWAPVDSNGRREHEINIVSHDDCLTNKDNDLLGPIRRSEEAFRTEKFTILLLDLDLA